MNATPGKWVRVRIILVGAGLLFLGLAIWARFFHLQIIQGAELKEKADQEINKLAPVLPVRGLILDSKQVELAVSSRVSSVVAHPGQIKQAQRLSRELAPLLGFKPLEVTEILTRARPFVWVRRHLTPEREEAFKGWLAQVESRSPAARNLRQRRDEDAVYLIPEARRYYPQQHLAGPILGFCNIDGQGLEGLEHQFEQDLYGKPKKVFRMLDARGHIVVTEEKAWDPEVMGNNLILTLDRTIQYIAEKELRRGVEKWRAAGGLVMVVRPRTGEILAMAQLPAMDPNFHQRYSEEARRNRNVTHAIEPGSVFKVFIAAAALDAGIVKPSDRFHCENGVWRLGAREVIHDCHPYGALTVQQVIQKSSNIGAAKIGNKLGGGRLHDYLRAFGFGGRTGILFPGENAGLLKNLRQTRSPLDRATCAFGQGVSVTPLQLTMALAAIGNQGVLMEPLLVKEITDPKGEKIREFHPRPVRSVISPRTAEITLAIMETVTQPGGTAKDASPPGFATAGKTGTAQKLVGGAYSRSKYNSVFMGLVPAQKPELAITVIVEESKGAIYGGVVAAPIFREIAGQALRVLGHYPQTEPLTIQAGVLPTPSPKAAPPPKPAEPSEPKFPKGPVQFKVMPDLKGLTIRQVADLLHRAGLKCRLEGSGLAVGQDPPPGAPLAPGTVCSVKFQSNS
ncbi:MAG: PASTA domain-containing protein [Deltaproteobacteria bacterium]|nr:PASTA domain-containing protein [Deltaproteobacteria bacterium]